MKALFVLGLSSLVVACGGSKDMSGVVLPTVKAEVTTKTVASNNPACVSLSLAGNAVCPDPSTIPTTQIVKDGVPTTVLDPSSAFSIASVKELPICCPEKEGALVFIKDTAAFKTCNDNQWSDINLQGSAGVNGRNIGISIEEVTSAAICPNGGDNYHFYYDNDASKSFTAGDEFFAENPICNGAAGTNGTNGTNGQDARVTYQMVCDGTLGMNNAYTVWSPKLLVDMSVHFEYTETLTGDKIMSARIIDNDMGFENSVYKIFPKNAPTNITFTGMGDGKALYVNKVRILGGNATIGFYPTHGTGGFGTYLQVEEASLDSNIIDGRHTVSGNLTCTAATY